MDDRAKALLKTLVERYIADGQPVGSRTLSKVFDLSPATIRNVMADLEDLGLIHSPHTSAGRIPTPRGYRMFVDSLLTVRPYELSPNLQIADCLPAAEPGRAVMAAASLLSNLSQFAGVVLTPSERAISTWRSFSPGARRPARISVLRCSATWPATVRGADSATQR